ncbi:MAG: class I SAM-dependent methyltransferase [Methanoregula sp.]|jgi:ubiquinone/menaquinone biosynthesis C-methylase UbiE|uniref:class I SAM-dependent methyltransferase n=1 Tax=Methanoregula sp. TaxID=2052170 RepID=UPI0025EF5A93|nr:class I SAM-dependent methyltransferase [Methanoregula sp.]MCK9630857.1 class I SAM-dependent methyltransferase [Methanoregula sp.]
MLFLSEREQHEWRAYADEILKDRPAPAGYDTKVRQNLVPAFHFYIATFLAAHGAGEQALAWAKSAVLEEEDGLFGLAFLAGFLERYDNRLTKPAQVFADPQPFIHFTTVPLMSNARVQFVRHCGQSLPVFDHPVRFMDIGCGNGALAVAVLSHLRECGKIPGFDEILLVDPSPAMANLAESTLRAAFPDVPITTGVCRIQDCSGRIDKKIDIAMSSLAYHHMPVEDKRIHLKKLKPWIDHFLLFEMDADIDTSDRFSPALALAVYQSYGRIFDCIYAHDAPVEVVNECIDQFLMTEVISILTEPRGERSDYHMLRGQWNTLLAEVLGPEFSLLCDSSCHADDYMGLITLHYGRTG